MKSNYYFTFGQGQINVNGEEMKDYYVRVVANNIEEATLRFREDFATPIMGDPLNYCSGYPIDDFSHQYFPKGEYAELFV